MTPKDLFLILNFKTRLDDSILIIASIHVVVGLGRVVQLMWIIHHPRRALLIVPHEHGVESGLQRLRLCICQDNMMRFRDLLLGNHLHGVFFFDDDHIRGNSRWRRHRGWHSSRGCGGVSSIIVILIISILIAAVVCILIGEHYDELIARLDHSFNLGLLLPQLLGIFPQPLS
jgi:hypothetical protein